MADTIRVTTSSLVVAETSSPASETQTRLSNVRLMIISGVTDLPMALPTGTQKRDQYLKRSADFIWDL